MPLAARLTGVGTFFAYDYDERSLAKPSISSIGTAFAYEFDENVGVAVTLTGSTRMRHLPEVGTASALTFGSLSGSGNWVEGVLANNGKIYGIPYDATQVLEIDPVGLTTSTFGSLSGYYPLLIFISISVFKHQSFDLLQKLSYNDHFL